MTTNTKNADNPIRKACRTLAVVVPLVFAGFYVGVMQPSGRIELPDVTMEDTSARLDVVDSQGRPTTDPGLSALGPAAKLQLTGNGMNKVLLETSNLPLQETLAELDRRGRSEGWKLHPGLTRTAENPDEDSGRRYYMQNGNLRIAIVSPPLTPGDPERAVTIFEGVYRSTR